MQDVVGWDIGGVNTKVARVVAGAVVAVRGRPYEVQRNPTALVGLLRALAVEVGAQAGAAHAITMTAELSQMFRTKRDGVAFVLDAVETAFPAAEIRVYAVDGRLIAPGEARRSPLAVAAANWSATAHAVAVQHPDAVLIDIGTTTTDMIPIVGGRVVARGRTDPERLASGELVYTGALRTPTEALAPRVPLGREMVGASAEGFALSGDVHLWRGDLAPADYTVPTPDGRPATRQFAGERLARVICADRELLDEAAVSSIADALAAAQLARIVEDLRRVLARHPSLSVAVVTGLGAFLGEAAARVSGLEPVRLAAQLGEAAARCAPAASVALLLDRTIRGDRSPLTVPGRPAVATCANRVDTVVKLGGGVLSSVERFKQVLSAIGIAARRRALLIVPGGGPFADAVRDVDRRLALSDDAAHWMAVLAMDQYACLVATQLVGGEMVAHPREIDAALAAGRVPVLAPSRWLRDSDPLPHSWQVTSDSIAAWVTGQLAARRLVVIKPPGAEGEDLVDAHFARTLPAGVTVVIVAADRIDALHAAFSSEAGA
jgi:probable H4MPT-linked C1 transfer pathway protein